MINGIPTELERRCPILLVSDAINHLIDRMTVNAITARDAKDAVCLLTSLWVK